MNWTRKNTFNWFSGCQQMWYLIQLPLNLILCFTLKQKSKLAQFYRRKLINYWGRETCHEVLMRTWRTENNPVTVLVVWRSTDYWKSIEVGRVTSNVLIALEAHTSHITPNYVSNEFSNNIEGESNLQHLFSEHAEHEPNHYR